MAQRRSLKSYILRRTISMIGVFFAVTLIIFLLVHFAPGDPLIYLAGDYALPPAVRAEVTTRYGLDQPLYVQLFRFWANILVGNLGESITFRSPVLSLIVERTPATLLLAGASLVWSIVLGLLLGVVSALRFRTKSDVAISIFTAIGYSMPTFVVGLILIIVFAVWLPLFPIGGMSSISGGSGLNYITDVLYHLILPGISLGTYSLTVISRLTRARMIEVLQEDFITTARGKGIPEGRVIFKHALTNASLPIVTIVGLMVSFIFAGAVLTETVFSWPGLGRLLTAAVFSRDYPLIMGMFTVITVFVLISILATDIIYTMIDPRIRLG